MSIILLDYGGNVKRLIKFPVAKHDKLERG